MLTSSVVFCPARRPAPACKPTHVFVSTSISVHRDLRLGDPHTPGDVEIGSIGVSTRARDEKKQEALACEPVSSQLPRSGMPTPKRSPSNERPEDFLLRCSQHQSLGVDVVCRIVVVGPMAKDHHHLASDRSEREEAGVMTCQLAISIYPTSTHDISLFFSRWVSSHVVQLESVFRIALQS